KLDRSETLGLHDQVAAELRRAIAEGEALPGERLPPARDLAAVLAVNRNTVLRALRLLRDEGLLEFRRGRGITVAGTRERGAVVAVGVVYERSVVVLVVARPESGRAIVRRPGVERRRVESIDRCPIWRGER